MTKQDHHRAPPQDQFPIKLYALLQMVDVPGLLGSDGGAAWFPHGRAFKVLDKDQFMDNVLMFFKATKIRSFYRQLNLLGFKRLGRGQDRGAWYHEAFLRGRPEEMKNMVRIKIKGTGNCQAKDEDAKDPDFYAMPPLLPAEPQKPQVSVSRSPVNSSSSPRRMSTEMLEATTSSADLDCELMESSFPSAEEIRFCQIQRSSICQRDAFRPTISQSMPYSTSPMMLPFPRWTSKPALSAQVSLSSQILRYANSSLPSSGTSSPVKSPVPSKDQDNVEDLKRWPTANLKPLPYDEDQGAHDCVPTYPSLLSLAKTVQASAPEPEPFQHEERDDFANYIDNAIQLM